MYISITGNRTYSNPVNGVSFSPEDNDKITEIAQGLALVSDEVRSTIRNAVAREIIWLEQLGDWTAGEAEAARRAGLELALLTYQATYTAGIIKHLAKPATCNCRCMRGENCGGCGHDGCGFRAEIKS